MVMDVRESTQLKNIDFVRVGALASFVLAVVIAIFFVCQGLLTDNSPRLETSAFLVDAADRLVLANVVGWIVPLMALLLVPVALGVYYGLRRWSEDLMRIFLIAALIGATLQAMVSISAAAAVGYTVPAWAETTNEAARAALTSDLQTLAWISDATLSMFHVVFATAFLAASLVMFHVGGRWWRTLGWLGVISSFFQVIGAFSLAWEYLEFAHLIIGITVFLWFPGVGIGLWRLRNS